MPLKKNISSRSEDTQLLTVFQAHFTDFLNLARIRLICLFISSLCKVRSVNFSKLSSGFDNKAASSSNYRRIQRFIAEVELPMKWISQLIFSLLPQKDSLVLVIDRTNWKLGEKNINILMLGVSYKNVAFPLMFRMLDKRGNSHTSERIALIQDFINWFGKDCIDCLLADREFVGEDWLGFLNENNIRYHIRIRNNFKIYCPKRQKEVTAWHLFNNLKTGQLRHYSKIMQIRGEYCYLSGMKTIKDGKLDFCIVVSFNKPHEALEKYKQRWQIELRSNHEYLKTI
ncbi:Transposase DDE domain-containing protein [Paenimyroides aquimaris]|uniref:Transposase DDE domain-containing protein n=1 Tax=Paenimyroides marinum TaxID=1159016 RepID=A0A1H6LHN0_9FLAO|nr:IS4 family transposase [Paenimyroides aquimaris]SEH84079.1 Transposase DDE domain-containing protein [Paenimyroides aquimaris]